MSLRPHYQATLKVGWPIAVGQIGTIMVGFADTLMVGHYNTPSLAAASFVNSVFNLFLFLTMGYSYGLTPLAGRLFGQRQYRRAGALLKEAVCTNALYGILIIIGLLLVYSQVSHMGQDPKLLPLIRPYFLIMVGSMPFVILFNLLRQFTDAATDTAVAMWILLSSNVLNIVGNYLLINGIGPLPELGLNGAGLSTLLARAYTAVALTLFLLRSPRYRAALQGWRICRVSRSAIRNINRFSLPISLQMGMETGAFTLSGIMVGWLGAVQLAGYQVIITISTLGFLFFYSFGASTSIRISLFAGQDNWTEVRRASQAGRNILLMLCSATCVLFLTLGPWLVDSFTPDAAVRRVGYALLLPLVFYQLGDAMQICYANCLRGTSHVQSVAWIAGISYLGVSIPLAYVLGIALPWGEQGIFTGLGLGLFTAALLYFLQFRRVMKRYTTA